MLTNVQVQYIQYIGNHSCNIIYLILGSHCLVTCGILSLDVSYYDMGLIPASTDHNPALQVN